MLCSAAFFFFLLILRKYLFFTLLTCPSSADTAATLTHTKELPTGIYDVNVEVKDLQGYGKVQTVNVRICQCKNGVCLAKQKSVELGPLGILALLLPLALLLLLCKSPH